ncbi:type 2 periplasmic-binding domain-containing protein [Konateibacter massiliensis]|uniref:ABC transporter substrate-binding protein n=1 Tax=Konateibacter massiliensis TaxID=2002841 RepID=UPI000C151573|nr:ABC transporter substrate-binding protein [Konateibacter massiliensis]
MKKKVISLLLCTTLVVTSLAGCGGTTPSSAETAQEETASDSGNSKYKEFITVDVFDELANYQGIQSGWFAKVVKDKFNMELNIIARNVAGGGETLYQTRSAAGDLGELIVLDNSNGKLNDLITSGLVMDCTDLMKDKDLMKNYSSAIEKMNTGLSQEGIWAFPNSISSEAATEPSEGLEPTFGPYIRWDYYAQLGYPQMATLDDFLDVLEDMQELARAKEGNDKIYAISLFKDWDDNMMNNAKQFACLYGYDEIGFVLAKADGSDYSSIIDTDSIYTKVLKFLYEANKRGLVDPDSTTQNYDTLQNKYQKGTVLYCPWPWLAQNQFNTQENKAAGKGYMMATIDDMQIFSYGNCPEGNSQRVIAIGSTAKDPERLADFIDWLYSAEGMELNGQANGAAGIEGLTWEKNADGKATLTEYGKTALPSNEVAVPEEYGGGNWKDGVSTLNFKPVNLGDIDPNTGEPYDWQLWETTIADSVTPLTEDWSGQTKASTTMEYLQNNNLIIVAPGSSYATPEADSNITTIRGQCKAVIVENAWKMIFANDDSEFASYLETMQTTANGLGYAEVLAVDMQNAQDQNVARVASAEAYPSQK